MRAKPYVICLGELLIDFTAVGYSDSGAMLFEQNPGGAPANVARNLARLGSSVGFVGKVGEDPFGEFLRDTMIADGVDMQGLSTTNAAPTTLAFVHLGSNGEREFSFVRTPGADTLLSGGDLPDALVAGAAVLHFGSLSLTHEPAASALRLAIDIAQKCGANTCMDVNLRPMLWGNLREARARIKSVLPLCDILKASGEELMFLLDEEDGEYESRGMELLAYYHDLKCFALTLGEAGSMLFYRTDGGSIRVATIPQVKTDVVDTTGAGDAYTAALLHRILLAGGLASFTASDREVFEAGCFAGRVAAQCVTHRGALILPLTHEGKGNYNSHGPELVRC